MYTINAFDLILGSLILILFGVALGILMKKDNTEASNSHAKSILNILWIISGIYIFILVFNTFLPLDILKIKNEVYPLLAGIGIMLSAFLASISVMNSVQNTNRIEEEKEKRELYDRRLIIYNTLSEIINDNPLQSYLKSIKPIIEFNNKVSVSEFIFKSIISKDIDKLTKDLRSLFWEHQIIEELENSLNSFPPYEPKESLKGRIPDTLEEREKLLAAEKDNEMNRMILIVNNCKEIKEKIKIDLKLI